MIGTKSIRFDQGYRFYDSLKIDSFEGNKAYLVGQVSDEGPPEALYLGKIAEFNGVMGKDVWLDIKAAHVVYVIGKRRSGKSYSLGAIVEGLVSSALSIGERKRAALILDTLNIYWTMEKTP